MALSWVKYSDGMPLSGAVIGGYDQGNPLYVARALHEGCIVPGKFHAVYKTSYISWAGKELEKKEGFDLLLGSALDWKPFTTTVSTSPVSICDFQSSIFGPQVW